MSSQRPRNQRSPRPSPKKAQASANKTHEADPQTRSRVRLQKVLARAGLSSRRGGEVLITEGRVEVNGRVVTELGVRVDPAVDEIRVDGRAIELETRVYLVMNKPDGVVCSAESDLDDRGRPTVVSLVRGIKERVVPVGRLDFHTRGVLLLTNDGDLAARLTHPRHKVPKTYHVKFQGQLKPPALEALLQGVTLEDGTRTRELVEISVIRDTQTNTWAQLTLMQGLYRQVRRMGEAIGHPVLKLIRVSFAGVTADGLREGEWRRLREEEVLSLQLQGAAKAAGPSGDRKSSGGRKGSSRGRTTRSQDES